MVRSMMFFKSVKLMFWAGAVLCAVYVKNRCPSHALKNKTPYEMWYGHIPSMRHLRVFGSTCYALIPKEQRSKLDARSQKCIFLGYSNTTKGYRLYDETNKKFILSRDVIFLESSKKEETVERQLDHVDRFTCVKTYHEFDDEIPYLEWGILILGQSLESPFEAPSSLHEEVPATSSEVKDRLDDVIKKIEKLRLDEDSTPSQSTEQPRPSQKRPPNWLTKTLESVHPDEVGKTGTKISSRQDGGNEDNSISGDVDDMVVSYDCELNLSANLEPTSFEEATSHDEWKEAMQKEYDALIKNETWKLVDPPFGTIPIGCKWAFKNKYRSDSHLISTKQGSWQKDLHRKKVLIMRRRFPPQQNGIPSALYFPWQHRMDVKTAFLNGDLKENVFMSQPEVFVVKGQEHKV
jgi:hypothetical protein